METITLAGRCLLLVYQRRPLVSIAKFYQIHESQRNIIAAGAGWYRWSFGKWRIISLDIIPPELRDNPLTPPMRGDKWFTERQLDMMGVKMQ
jgi:hypothetical protein